MMRHGLTRIVAIGLLASTTPLVAQDMQDDAEMAGDDAAPGDDEQVTITDEDGESAWNEELGDFPGDETDEDDYAVLGFQDQLPTIASAAVPSPPPPPPPPPSEASQPRPSMVLRVSLGTVVKDAQAPWQAQIAYATDPRSWSPPPDADLPADKPAWEMKHVCGGTLIDTDWVLTAAHCVSAAQVRQGLTVLLGAEDISQPQTGMTYRVERAIIHSGYDKYSNDIALLKLASDGRARNGAQIAPIKPYTGPLPAAGTPVSGTGWGRTQQAGPEIQYSAQLWRADQKLIPPDQCRLREGFGPVEGTSRQRIGNTVICAGDTTAKTCSGDSGGPLVLKGAPTRLLGIVSWNKRDCSNPANPGVYTNVSAFTGWIDKAKASNPARGVVQFLGN